MEIDYIVDQKGNPQYVSLYDDINQVKQPNYLMSQDIIQQRSQSIKDNQQEMFNPLIERYDKVILNNKQNDFKEDNINLETLLKQEGVHFKVTSHIRNTKTAKGTKSYHSTGLAYDIQPTDGNSY